MKKIVVEYSEDFRKSKVVSQIYGILRDKGFDPSVVKNNYLVSLGTGQAEYIFTNGANLPKKSDLEKMLVGMNFDSLEMLDSEEEKK